MKKLAILCGVLFIAVLAATLWWVHILLNTATPTAMQLELLKTGLNLVVVVGLGTGVSLIAAEFNRRRQHRLAEREFRKQCLEDCVRAYGDTKRIRRRLRARCDVVQIADDGSVTASPHSISTDSRTAFDAEMDALMNAQLAFEALVWRVESHQPLFEEPEILKRHLQRADDYLSQLIREYQRASRKLRQTNTVGDEVIPLLRVFVGPRRESAFETEFVKPYKAAVLLMQDDVLHEPRSTERPRLHTSAAA